MAALRNSPRRHTTFERGSHYHRSDHCNSPWTEYELREPTEAPVREQHESSTTEQSFDSGRTAIANEDVYKQPSSPQKNQSSWTTELYIISYLILFSMLGTLARLGLQALTFFPGAPIVFSELWANVAGTLIMGFLNEDRKIFAEERGTPTYANMILQAKQDPSDEITAGDLAAAKKAHGATKKTIPLFVGLATGFCGSFTSFSSFIRDTFLALSNDLPSPLNHPTDLSSTGAELTSTSSTVPRNAGFSILAVLSVIIITFSLCTLALTLGTELAQSLEPYTPTVGFFFQRQFLDRLSLILAFTFWLTAIILCIIPPSPTWRGTFLFALIFSPLGCLLRFYASKALNPASLVFPLGTFFVNILGTAVLGMAFNFQHNSRGTVVSCQVLQGVIDGFCGALTTISTFFVEVRALNRGKKVVYADVSVGVALAVLVAIMGSFRWTVGFKQVKCVR